MKRTADDTVNSNEKKNATISDWDSYRDVWKLGDGKYACYIVIIMFNNFILRLIKSNHHSY